MVFSSLVFLFIFLPAVIFLYFYSNNIKVKNIVLLIFSLLFYTWGEPIYILLMLSSILVNYFGAIFMDKQVKCKKLIFVSLVAANLGAIGYFKYANFFIDNLNGIFSSNILNNIEIILPIGISFYTFQVLSYIIDVYRGKVKVQKNLINLALYISLFPQLVAGPIVRYETIEKELTKRNESFDRFYLGIRRFIVGLGKKVIIANNAALAADHIYGSVFEHGTVLLWFAAVAYAVQIYFDFSGYSDMAIGLGNMFGFTFLENFNLPYIAKSITDFWRRWHISLSSWFRDYVYIPLGGNRVHIVKWIRNIFIVWFLTGMWHGASWNYIIWGLFYGTILLIEKFLLAKQLEKSYFLSRVYTVIIFLTGWVIFRLENFNEMFYALKNMYVFKNADYISTLVQSHELLFSLPFVIIGVLLSFFSYKKLKEKINMENNIIFALDSILILMILGLSIIFLISNKYNPFIYFKF